MTVIINGSNLRSIGLGTRVVGKLQTIAGAATHSLFTVAGGEVLITALWGVTTTAMAGANTVNVQTNPTTGDTVVVATATDLGTTDTAAGTTIGFNAITLNPTTTIVKGGLALKDLPVTTGAVESVITGAGADGAIQWYCTYVPLTDGASVVASA